MDGKQFDRLARAYGAFATRRTALGGLGAVTFGALVATGASIVGARGDRNRGVAAERKRRKRKKKACVPDCDRKICGPDGCAGTCGSCPGPTVCNGQGQCIGCGSSGDCPAVTCQAASCTSDTCTYTPVANGTACATGVCCGGGCADTQTDPLHCGACGNRCSSKETCRAGQCEATCDVCTSGCAFTSVQAAIDAATPGATIRLCAQLHQGAFDITKNLTLEGVGASPAQTVLRHPGPSFIDTDSGVTTTLRNLTVTGLTSGVFGAIRNRGAMTLERVHVTNNRTSTSGNLAGGMLNAGTTLTLIDCLVRDNRADQGGGIATGPSNITTLIRTQVEFNEATRGGGGGITNGSNAVLNVTDNSRIRANTASGAVPLGGGVLNIGQVSITGGSSITGNTPDNCVNAGGTGCP